MPIKHSVSDLETWSNKKMHNGREEQELFKRSTARDRGKGVNKRTQGRHNILYVS